MNCSIEGQVVKIADLLAAAGFIRFVSLLSFQHCCCFVVVLRFIVFLPLHYFFSFYHFIIVVWTVAFPSSFAIATALASFGH